MSLTTASAPPAPAATDGRSTRWAEHRRARRAELVSAAVRAISTTGPDVGMDEIAALAKTSKTVLYRHFADKDELHLAVAQRVDERVSAALRASSAGAEDFRGGLRAVIATYLQLVADDPNLYRFVTARTQPSGPDQSSTDPVAGLSAAVSAELTRLIGKHLRAGGLPRSVAAVWAHALVGMVRAGVDHAMGDPEPALGVEEVADALTELAWGGLAPSLEPTVPSSRAAGPDRPAATDLADLPVVTDLQEQP